MAKTKVIITGVAGFIGSNLADRLLGEGYDVVGIDNLRWGVLEQIPKGVEFHKLDVREKEMYPLFKEADFVFHMAAKNCISDCQDDPVETSDINVTGTVNVFEAVRQSGRVKKIIYAESSSVYEKITKVPTDESQVAPDSFYARSKVAENLFAEGYQRFYKVNSVGLRYFSVYGQRQDYRRTVPPLPAAFIIKALKGEAPLIYGTGKKRRDFIHVDDINDFHILCMKSDAVNNRIFNLGTGTNVSIAEVYDIVNELVGTNIPAIFKPNKDEEGEIGLADITAAKSVGWAPKTSFKEGARGLVGYIKSEIEKGNIK